MRIRSDEVLPGDVVGGRRAAVVFPGNARVMRQLVEDLLPVQAWRLSTQPDLEQLPDRDLQTLTVEDVRAATGRE